MHHAGGNHRQANWNSITMGTGIRARTRDPVRQTSAWIAAMARSGLPVRHCTKRKTPGRLPGRSVKWFRYYLRGVLLEELLFVFADGLLERRLQVVGQVAGFLDL